MVEVLQEICAHPVNVNNADLYIPFGDKCYGEVFHADSQETFTTTCVFLDKGRCIGCKVDIKDYEKVCGRNIVEPVCQGVENE